MPKPIELPAGVARRLVEDMRLFHIEPNAIKRTRSERQLYALKQHYAGKLRLGAGPLALHSSEPERDIVHPTRFCNLVAACCGETDVEKDSARARLQSEEGRGSR